MKSNSVIGQLARLAFVILAGMLLAWFITLVIMLVKASFDFQSALIQSNTLLESTGMLRLLQAVQSLCIFVIPPFLFCLMNEERPTHVLQFRKPSGEKIALAVLSLVVAIPLINALVAWNESMQLPSFLNGVEEWMRIAEKKATELTLKMMSGTAWYDLALSLLIVSVLAGFGEELLFRGLLQGTLVKLLSKKHKAVDGTVPTWIMHVSIWAVAFLFSTIHLQFFGFIPRLLLGAWFGYLLWWTGSIWVPILAHMTNNALATFFLFAETNGWVSESPDNLGTADTSWMSLLSFLLLSACAVLLRRKSKPTNGYMSTTR